MEKLIENVKKKLFINKRKLLNEKQGFILVIKKGLTRSTKNMYLEFSFSQL